MTTNRKSNRLSAATMVSKSTFALNDEYNLLLRAQENLEDARKAVEVQREAAREATARLIMELEHRLTQKLRAKLPYIGKKVNNLTDQITYMTFKFDRVLSITDRGVIVRVAIDLPSMFTRRAIELSHEQIAMSEEDFSAYIEGYSKFIKDTYAVIAG